MNADAQRRRQLGEFLRIRRLRLARADLGLPPIGRRSMGLRREEAAALSGMSITWYSWLEQGRDTRPSRNVLDSLARTFRLSVAEHAYILTLAGYAAPPPTEDKIPRRTPKHARRLLAVLDDLPAYVASSDWQIVGWTRTLEAIYPNVATVREADRNELWLMFTDPDLRELMHDWEDAGRHLAADFRTEVGPRLTDPLVSRLISRLFAESDIFRSYWENHDVRGFTPRRSLIHHPVAGDLHFWLHRLAPAGHPDLHMVLWIPELTTDTRERLAQVVNGRSCVG